MQQISLAYHVGSISNIIISNIYTYLFYINHIYHLIRKTNILVQTFKYVWDSHGNSLYPFWSCALCSNNQALLFIFCIIYTYIVRSFIHTMPAYRTPIIYFSKSAKRHRSHFIKKTNINNRYTKLKHISTYIIIVYYAMYHYNIQKYK